MKKTKLLTAASVKERAKNLGADLCGIAPAARFDACVATGKLS